MSSKTSMTKFSLYHSHPSIASTIKPYKPYIPNRPPIEQLTANTIAICVSMIICFFMIETHLNNLCDCLGSLWCDYNLLSWTVKLVLRQTMFGLIVISWNERQWMNETGKVCWRLTCSVMNVLVNWNSLLNAVLNQDFTLNQETNFHFFQTNNSI